MQPSAPKPPATTNAADKLTEPSAIKLVQAVNYTPGKRAKNDLRWIVLHAMDGGEDTNRAENCAAWMAGKLLPKFPPPRASAHYAIDADSVIQMVRDQDIAWHAPGANRYGIGIEHAGKANQTDIQWRDQFGISMLNISASLVARLCTKYAIPAHFLNAEELTRGHWGITTHLEVNKAFKGSTHTDPGPNFPLDWYIGQVKSAQLRLAIGA